MLKTPVKIGKCPIKDIVVEIRFESELFPSAVFGVLYSNLKSKFPNVTPLPILQLSNTVLEKDPAFKYKPHYSLSSNKKYSIQIGPKVVAIIAPMPYNGWEEYKVYVFETLTAIFGLNIITMVSRVGVRVVNVFENEQYGSNVFENIRMKLTVGDFTNELDNTTIRTQVLHSGFNNTIQIAKKVDFKSQTKIEHGSMLDIDTFKEYTDNSFLKSFEKEIESAHIVEKEMFFTILKEEFIKKLEPSYE